MTNPLDKQHDYEWDFDSNYGWRIRLAQTGSHIFLTLMEGRHVIEHHVVSTDKIGRYGAFITFLKDSIEWTKTSQR